MRRIMKAGVRMNVVGIVCNEKFQIPRKTRKVIRAILHNAKKDKIELDGEQKGLINFKGMVENYQSTMKDNIEVCRILAMINEL